MSAKTHQNDIGRVDLSYLNSSLELPSSDMFDSKMDPSTSHLGEMGFFSFEHMPTQLDSAGMSAFEMPVSPTMAGDDMFYSSTRPMHVDPTATWNGATEKAIMSNNVDIASTLNSSSIAKLLDDYEGPTNRAYGQITPPSENENVQLPRSAGKRADSGISQDLKFDEDEDDANTVSQTFSQPLASKRSMSDSYRLTKRARKDSQDEEIEEDDAVEGEEGDGKREKYREKNRVAAAKCRAKKKEHVDNLEDTHRTQSMLNTALKQTEKSLRDELSFWRTQALQHTFCQCHPIQDYNMRKARNLAAESILGTSANLKSPISPCPNSLSITSPEMKLSGVHQNVRRLSENELGVKVISPSTSSMSSDMRSNPPSSSNPASRQSTSRRPGKRPSAPTLIASAFSSKAEQELKKFVSDVVE